MIFVDLRITLKCQGTLCCRLNKKGVKIEIYDNAQIQVLPLYRAGLPFSLQTQSRCLKDACLF